VGTLKVVRVTRTEFELDDGSIFPIMPSLQEDMTPSEFQRHYDYAAAFVCSSRTSRRHVENTSDLGQERNNQNCPKSRRSSSGSDV